LENQTPNSCQLDRVVELALDRYIELSAASNKT